MDQKASEKCLTEDKATMTSPVSEEVAPTYFTAYTRTVGTDAISSEETSTIDPLLDRDKISKSTTVNEEMFKNQASLIDSEGADRTLGTETTIMIDGEAEKDDEKDMTKEDEEEEEAIIYIHTQDEKLQFIRRVYSLITLQAASTVSMTCWFVFDFPTMFFVAQNFPMYISSFVVFIVMYLILAFLQVRVRKYPLYYVMMGGFTFGLAYLVATVSCFMQMRILLVSFFVALVSNISEV